EQNKNALSCSSLVLGNLSSAIVDKSGAKGENRNNITGLGGRGLRRAHHETARARKHGEHGTLLNRVGRGERKLPWHMVEGSADVVLADAIGGKCGAESGEGEGLRRLTALKAGNGGLQEKRCADQRRYRISRQAEQGQITKPPIPQRLAGAHRNLPEIDFEARRRERLAHQIMLTDRSAAERNQHVGAAGAVGGPANGLNPVGSDTEIKRLTTSLENECGKAVIIGGDDLARAGLCTGRHKL